MFRRYAYGWITLAFFLGSFLLHWYFGWNAFVEEQMSHGQTPETGAYLNEMMRDTFEKTSEICSSGSYWFSAPVDGPSKFRPKKSAGA